MRILPIISLLVAGLVTGKSNAATLLLPSAAELDLDNDGTPELTVTSRQSSSPFGLLTRSETFVVINAHASFQFLTTPGSTEAARQESGSLVGATPTGGTWANNPPGTESASVLYSTVITDPSTGFSSLSFNVDFPYDLGFRFEAPDGTHYGWLRLRPPGDIIGRAVITSLHYNDTPGAPVTVGSTIPEPSTFLLLASTLLATFTRRR